MLITVVIPTYNRRASLANCLESLFQQTYGCDQFEIIVVIDGSTDGTLDYLQGLRFPCASQILQQENRGQAAARNVGIRAANGKYILLLDDDFICDSRLVEEHLKTHTAPGLVVVGPILRDAADTSLPAIAVDREIRPFYEQHSSGNRPEGWLPPNSSLERDLLLACGAYDEHLGSAREDTDLGLRLADLGVQFQYAAEASVHQRYSKSAAELVRDAETFGRNDVILLRKRPDYLRFSNLSQIYVGPAWKRLRQLLKTLEEKQRIVELLSAYLDTRQEAVRVVIGLEEAMPDLSNFVLIGAPARSGDEVLGRLAVIGPTRMDYQHTITAVSYIARLFDRLLNDSE